MTSIHRTTRPVIGQPVIGRKNHHGSRSQRGTEVAALFHSIVDTCKLVGADPYDYLRDATYARVQGRARPAARGPRPPPRLTA